jgi:hypothetical protein
MICGPEYIRKRTAYKGVDEMTFMNIFHYHLRQLGGEQLDLERPYYTAIGFLRMHLIGQISGKISTPTMVKK